MDLTGVDVPASTRAQLKQRAADRDLEAFRSEVELARLQKHQAALEAAGDSDGAAALDEPIADAGDNAQRLRRKADRAAQAPGAAITQADVNKARRAWLRDWRRQLQAEYVSHQTLADERRRVLALTGAAALDDDERAEVEAHLADNVAALAVIDAAAGVADDQLAPLSPPAPAKATARTTAKKQV